VRTRVVLLITAVVILVLVVSAAPSSAGGFCMGHTPSEGFTDTDGTQVSMMDFCFSPTVIRIDEGDEITWTNDDSEVHAVGGAVGAFGDAHSEVAPGDSVTYRFDREGTFPYVCIYHPGMAGAVVVGDGLGPAFKAGGIVETGTTDTDPPASSDVMESQPETAPTSSGSGSFGWATLLAVIAASGIVSAIYVIWRRRDEASGLRT
jgi:manganese oxidase